ncbi:MAG: isoleucine--tRNA ligase [Planctomycetes bacterium]|nr:isoleucine--tRNA ligase [Planctomycetota bacterium]
MFRQVSAAYDFPAMEESIVSFWENERVFHRSLDLPAPNGEFVFYEGPPTANGLPHAGHVLTRVIKDLFPRYRTMTGFRVNRKAGWDTHGLPVEIEVEKELGIEGKQQIEEFGVAEFAEKCMASVFRYTSEWERLTSRIGFWIDLDDAYVTFTTSYVESVWWALHEIWKKGLLYEGHKVIPYCPRCGTPLSSHEVGLGYKEVSDPSVFVRFRSTEDFDGKPLFYLAWTTTPWTLISNAALTVNPDFDYAFVERGGEVLVLAEALAGAVLGEDVPYKVLKTVKGSELEHRAYVPLYDFERVPPGKAHFVVLGSFVSLDDGTGVVHTAPAFGQDDYDVTRPYGVHVIQLVDEQGRLKPAVTPWAGVPVKKADPRIIRDLHERGLLFAEKTCRHDYPHCWRCETPLIYYARRSWFIRTTDVRDRMLANNGSIGWRPDHIRTGRFGNFLRDNVDWALSRERYWGTPLPVWRCGCGHWEVFASKHQLLDRSPAAFAAFDKLKAERGDALSEHMAVHKPYIDDVTIPCPDCGSEMRRVPEVIDCWFDSGAMPFAQWGYPHQNSERFAAAFPCDFISEAIDQTRGWFYSLLAISTMLFGESSYKNCIVLGLVCDEKGFKMSKSKGNYTDPWDILNDNGADAMRWYFYTAAPPASPVRFFPQAVREAQKEFLIKLWNVYSFFTIYANIDGFSPEEGGFSGLDPGDFASRQMRRPAAQRSLLDRWIVSELGLTVTAVRSALDGLDYQGATRPLADFVDGLSNWYVRRSRDRFWASGFDQDKADAYWTLYEVLLTLSRLLAPFVPFISEEIYRNLAAERMDGAPVSVHLTPYPDAADFPVDAELSEKMALARDVVSLGRSARAGSNIKVRQPLAEAVVILADPAKQALVEDLVPVIMEELNVKAVRFESQADRYVDYILKPNFPVIGPRFGRQVPLIKKALAGADTRALKNTLDVSGTVSVPLQDGAIVTLSGEEIEVLIAAREHYAAADDRRAVVVVNTDITPELRDEGIAREVVSRIQALRKEAALPYEARIRVYVSGGDNAARVLAAFGDYVRSETLCTELYREPFPSPARKAELDLEGESVSIGIALAE